VLADSVLLRKPALRLYLTVGKHAETTETRQNRMNFQCKELSISDDELGFTVTFSDSKSSDDQFKSVDELMNSGEKYLLIQRSYPEEEDDLDYYYIETSETDTELSPKDKMIVKLNDTKFEINWSGDRLEIGLNLSEKEQKELRKAFKVAFKERTILLE
jgi:hypothetical protein